MSTLNKLITTIIALCHREKTKTKKSKSKKKKKSLVLFETSADPY